MSRVRAGTDTVMHARMFRLQAVVIALLAGVGLALGPGAEGAFATPNYPVPYTFTADILASPWGPYTPPPGADVWSCRPAATHPYPVILVHGIFANETDNWQTYGPLLAAKT